MSELPKEIWIDSPGGKTYIHGATHEFEGGTRYTRSDAITPQMAARVLLDDHETLLEVAIQTMRNNKPVNSTRPGYLPALTAALRYIAQEDEA